MWREKDSRRKERENNTFYYFIRWFILFYWIVCKNKNWDVGWILKWIGKIDKIVFDDTK